MQVLLLLNNKYKGLTSKCIYDEKCNTLVQDFINYRLGHGNISLYNIYLSLSLSLLQIAHNYSRTVLHGRSTRKGEAALFHKFKTLSGRAAL